MGSTGLVRSLLAREYMRHESRLVVSKQVAGADPEALPPIATYSDRFWRKREKSYPTVCCYDEGVTHESDAVDGSERVPIVRNEGRLTHERLPLEDRREGLGARGGTEPERGREYERAGANRCEHGRRRYTGLTIRTAPPLLPDARI
jgi:hypothetical protein